MTLRALPEGLAPDVVEQLRWETFAHKRAHAVRSPEELVRFAETRGFVLLYPQPGLHYPSALEASAGRPLLDFVPDQRRSELVELKNHALGSGKLIGAWVLAGLPALVAANVFADFCALRSAQPAESLPADAKRIVAVLEAQGALDAEKLCTECGVREHAGARHQRFHGALEDALRQCAVVETGAVLQARQRLPKRALRSQPAAPAAAATRVVYDLFHRPCAARKEPQDLAAARRRIVARYMRNVLVESAHQLANVLGWPIDVVAETCEQLLRKRTLRRHPCSRPNQVHYEVVATDLLQPSLHL